MTILSKANFGKSNPNTCKPQIQDKCAAKPQIVWVRQRTILSGVTQHSFGNFCNTCFYIPPGSITVLPFYNGCAASG